MGARRRKAGLRPVLMLAAVLAAAGPALPASGQDRESLQAFELYQKKKWSRAFKELLPLAQAGNDRAMLLVGEMYLYGEGINQNETEGLAWLEKAAQAGHARDAYFVAGRYLAKWKHDYAAAAKYVIGAAELGHPEAQAIAADMYGSGLGIAQDKAKAEKWYRLAAEHSESSWAVYLGARSYLDGAERNYGKAAELMRRAAEMGHGLAQDDLGVMYLEGSLVPRDSGEAERWLTLAVGQGVPTAYLHLGSFYAQAGQPKNAVRCYIDAFRAGIDTENQEVTRQAVAAVMGAGLIGHLDQAGVIAKLDKSPIGACKGTVLDFYVTLFKSYIEAAR